jgi:hypothetical protein
VVEGAEPLTLRTTVGGAVVVVVAVVGSTVTSATGKLDEESEGIEN